MFSHSVQRRLELAHPFTVAVLLTMVTIGAVPKEISDYSLSQSIAWKPAAAGRSAEFYCLQEISYAHP
jgi:hypothetical protein